MNLVIIDFDNGLSPNRRQAIFETNHDLSLNEHRGTNLGEIWIRFVTFSLKKMRLKMSPAKSRPSCLGLNVLMHTSIQKLSFHTCGQTYTYINQHQDLGAKRFGVAVSLWYLTGDSLAFFRNIGLSAVLIQYIALLIEYLLITWMTTLQLIYRPSPGATQRRYLLKYTLRGVKMATMHNSVCVLAK